MSECKKEEGASNSLDLVNTLCHSTTKECRRLPPLHMNVPGSVRCNLGAAWPFSVHCWWLRPLTLPASIGTLAPSTNRLRHLSRISHLSPFPSRRHHCPRHCDNGRLDLPRRQLTVCQLLHIDSGCPPAGDGWVGGAYQRYFAEMYPVPGYIHDVMKQGF